jgi:hypothetical protein
VDIPLDIYPSVPVVSVHEFATSITLVSGTVVNGRALAEAVDVAGAVTMDGNTVVRPAP